jgi:hypothetical protein
MEINKYSTSRSMPRPYLFVGRNITPNECIGSGANVTKKHLLCRQCRQLKDVCLKSLLIKRGIFRQKKKEFQHK